MEKSKEALMIKEIINAIENPIDNKKKHLKQKRTLLIFAWIGLVITFLMYFQNLQNIYLPIIAIASGASLGFAIFFNATIGQWELLSKHVNLELLLESLKKEESEIET